MRLHQRRVFKSILNLPDTVVPDFTLITGMNGSGKSHLLDAIIAGAVETDITNDPGREVGKYTWNDLVPNDVGITSYNIVYQHRDWFIQQIRNRKDQVASTVADR